MEDKDKKTNNADQNNVPDNELVNEEEVCVCLSVRRASRIITQLYDHAMRHLGYRATQINLLGVISKFGPTTIKSLSEVVDTEPTTLLRNIRLLEREKLILINEGEDRRERIVSMSPKGRDLLVKALPVWKSVQDKIAARVGAERLNHLLNDLSQALEEMRKE